MGTWGMGTFEDDDALDWLHDLEEQGLPILERALSMQLPEYLSAPDGQVLLAAAEVVAAMKGSPADDLPDAIDDWLRGQHAGAAHRLAPLAGRRVAGHHVIPGLREVERQGMQLSGLGRLGGDGALAIVDTLVANPDAARRRLGLTALVRWPDATVSQRLLDLLSKAQDPAEQDAAMVLAQIVEQLPDKFRVPVQLYYFEGESVTEVALRLGCPAGTVKTHLARAREELRARLKAAGLGEWTLWN